MKQIVEIEADIPEGWEAVRYGKVKRGEYFLDSQGRPDKAGADSYDPWLIVRRKWKWPVQLEMFDKIYLNCGVWFGSSGNKPSTCLSRDYYDSYLPPSPGTYKKEDYL